MTMNCIENIEKWLREFAAGKLGIARDYLFDYRQYASVLNTIITEETDAATRDLNCQKILAIFADDITHNRPPENIDYFQETLRMIAICWK
jgi:hypothetical protein